MQVSWVFRESLLLNIIRALGALVVLQVMRRVLRGPPQRGSPCISSEWLGFTDSIVEADVPSKQPDALDPKQNRYFRRKLIKREFLAEDVVALTFELPAGESLQSLGIDQGLGDFVRIRPYSEEHIQAVEHPYGGRAYSPVSVPAQPGQFQAILKVYGPGGLSSLLSSCAIGSELLVTNHVEHVYWEERRRGYFCNKRNVNGDVRLGLIAFGIGITEIAPVALSELEDPRVKELTILWANKRWKDSEWVREASGASADLVHRLFATQAKGVMGDRLRIVHLLSQEQRPDCLKGRISPEMLRSVFLERGAAAAGDDWRFLAVGTADMMAAAYAMLAGLGFDLRQGDSWEGQHHLYKKLLRDRQAWHRTASPVMGMRSCM